MRKMDSLTMKAAALSEVPAGNALSVDRDEFAEIITKELKAFPISTSTKRMSGFP
jgi:methylenetetrahydrofolate--tRNA-(uracil-5-)-methyltransferase